MSQACCKRVCVLPALTLIAGSRLSIDLRPVLPDAVPILASFLRKNQRALKLCTLAALDILLRNYRYAPQLTSPEPQVCPSDDLT